MKPNCCGFSVAFANILCIEISTTFSSCWSQRYQCWYFFYFLGISLWLNLFPPCLKDLWWYGGRWKQNSLLVSRQKRVLTALTAWKWESGRPQPVPNCYPEFLFIPCYSRTHFWITYLKFTQQNTREKKSVKSLVAMWITKKKAQKNKFFSLGKRVKDFFFF